MERFGIFELLDALSALPRERAKTEAPEGGDESFSPPPVPSRKAKGLTSRREQPAFGSPPPDREEPGGPDGLSAPPEVEGSSHGSAPGALESFLKRHDALSKKAEKK